MQLFRLKKENASLSSCALVAESIFSINVSRLFTCNLSRTKCSRLVNKLFKSPPTELLAPATKSLSVRIINGLRSALIKYSATTLRFATSTSTSLRNFILRSTGLARLCSSAEMARRRLSFLALRRIVAREGFINILLSSNLLFVLDANIISGEQK